MRYKFKKEGIWFDPNIMEVGKRVHKAIEYYYKHAYKPDTSEEDILAKSYFFLRREWDNSLPAELLNKSYSCLSNFAKYEADNINRGIRNPPTVELKLVVDGMIGYLDSFNQKVGKACDFKTNTKPSVGYSYKLQATMYKYLLEKTLGMTITSFDFVFLFTGEVKQVRFSKATDKILDDIFYYKDCINASWKNDKFEKQPRTKSMCNWCQYKYYCGGVK